MLNITLEHVIQFLSKIQNNLGNLPPLTIHKLTWAVVLSTGILWRSTSVLTQGYMPYETVYRALYLSYTSMNIAF